jgi:DNA-binding NarL/FixJ family response regulator
MPQIPPGILSGSFWKDQDRQIRLMLVQSSLTANKGLRKLLESAEEVRIVVSEAVFTGVLTKIEETTLKPDIVLMDLPSDHQQARQILRSLPEFMAFTKGSRVLLLTGNSEAEILYQALRLGVMGMIEKDRCPETLLEAIRSVWSGRAWFDRVMMARVFTELAAVRVSESNSQSALEKQRSGSFSPREQELISLLGGAGNSTFSRFRDRWQMN